MVAPPYDVIDEADTAAPGRRHPANVVRLDLPGEEPGDEPDDRYRRAARTLAAWRSDGTLHKDPHPSIYVYEQTYRVPGTDVPRTQRGFFARLRLEAFGPGSGVLPHERTLAGPREDRYKLLRATGVNTSPVVGAVRRSATAWAARSSTARHRPGRPTSTSSTTTACAIACGRSRPTATAREAVAPLLAAAARGPITIADGHHRYETALRYRDERRMSRLVRGGPGVRLPPDALPRGDRREPLTVLPTHRVVRSLGETAWRALLDGLGALFEVRRGVDATSSARRFEAVALAAGGAGRFGLCARGPAGASWTARRDAFEPLLPARWRRPLRGLDVTLLGVALERLAGIDAEAVAAGAVAYTKSARARRSTRVDARASTAPTPRSCSNRRRSPRSLAVAADGDVMPQKSTYFYPKALTGLVINPHEW